MKASKALFAAIGAAMTVVITAPVLLSSQDLYQWGTDPHGLGLPPAWAWLVPVALDCAAVAMIGMTIVATWRRERPGIFEALVWVFAGTSAYAQYRHGVTAAATGGARDAWWAFPAFAVLGPVLLHVILSRLRRWARQDAGEQSHGAAGFGSRWLPGVAFRETLAAWAASRREDIDQAAAAVAYVREVKALKGLPAADALRYAFGALATTDAHRARVWLQARHVMVGQAAIDAVTAAPAAEVAPVRRAEPVTEPANPEPAATPGDQPKRGLPTAERVRRWHRLNPDLTVAQIVERVGVSESTARRHLAAARDATGPVNGNPVPALTATVREG